MATSSKGLCLSPRTSPANTLKLSTKTPLPISIRKNCQKFTLPSLSITNTLQDPFITSIPATTLPSLKPPISPLALDQPRKAADVLVEALERAGVDVVYAYPGSASVEIHQALSRSRTISNVLCRHEQGEIFAAEGYARASGRPGVCIATSGPGATNLVSGIADALHDSIPLIAITGQVPRNMIGTNSFQETPIVEITRAITKHNYLILDGNDIPRIVREAFFLAASGRPGPVLIDIPKDVQEQLIVPNWDQPMELHIYSISCLPEPPKTSQLQKILCLLFESRKPVLYVGGGCLNSHLELRRFVDYTGIPVTSTLMGIGAYPFSHELSLRMLGMYGTVYANYAVDNSDLLLAFGVRFHDRVTGKLEAFATRAKLVHVDIDSREIGKNKQPHFSICGDLKMTLQGLNTLLEEMKAAGKLDLDFWGWREELKAQKKRFPLSFTCFGGSIRPQHAIQVLDELTNSDAIITTGVGQHQMWAAQWYNYKNPRQLITSSGLGAMGFGLPAAIGAAVASPASLVVDIDGDGSFLMNIQELATIAAEELNVKIMVLNNQHLGMVVQWEDWNCEGNRGDTYLGHPSKNSKIFPDFLKFAEGCDIPAARITQKSELRGAILKMLQTPGPYLLDVIMSHHEYVFPIIPAGGSFRDVIIEEQDANLVGKNEDPQLPAKMDCVTCLSKQSYCK